MDANYVRQLAPYRSLGRLVLLAGLLGSSGAWGGVPAPEMDTVRGVSRSMVAVSEPETTSIHLETDAQHLRPTITTLGRLPLSFEANQGQVDGRVKYLARGKGYTLFLTETEAVLALRSATSEKLEVRSEKQESEKGEGSRAKDRNPSSPPVVSGDPASNSPLTPHPLPLTSSHESVIRMTFAGANQTPTVNGDEKLPGIVNYFIGNDPEQWRTKIPTYKKVQYDNLYEGIDLVYYGNQGQLEYDLVVAPGADPSQIQLAFEGTDNLTVDPTTGDLVLTVEGSSEKLEVRSKGQEGDGTDRGTASDPNLTRLTPHPSPLTSSTLRLLKPHVYQLVDGKKIEIAANYVVLDKSDERQVADVSPAQAGIQASLRHSRENGDPGDYQAKIDSRLEPAGMTEGGAGMADKENSLPFVRGLGSKRPQGRGVESPELPRASRLTPHEASRSVTIQLAAYDPTKPLIIDPVLHWSRYVGGSGFDQIDEGIAVDGAGNVYVAGTTDSTDFPTVPAGLGHTTGGTFDAFVSKINSKGTALIYSTYLGSAGDDRVFTLAIDKAGNAYAVGQTDSAAFPASVQLGPGGGLDVFIAKLNAQGDQLLYATKLGGDTTDRAFGVEVDGVGQAYLTGFTNSTNFPTANPFQAATGGSADAFIAKLNAAGSALEYSTYLGGEGGDEAFDIAVDATGAATITGKTTSADASTATIPFPLLNAFDDTFEGGTADGFVSKLNAAGTDLVYSTYLGGDGGDEPTNIAVDRTGAAYVVGRTSTPHDSPAPFTLTANGYRVSYGGASTDAFMTKLSDVGALEYSTYLGGSGSDTAFAVGLDVTGAPVITGTTRSSELLAAPFPLLNPIQATLAGDFDAFLTKFDLTRLSDGIDNDGVNGADDPNEALVFSTFLGGSLQDQGLGIAVDSTGTAYIAGDTLSTDFDDATLLGASVTGGTQAFVAKVCLDPPGPTPGTFTDLSPATLSVARVGHRVTRLQDGRILITGGTSGGLGNFASALNTAEIYDPATQAFTSTGTMGLTPRTNHTATLLPDGRVLVAGGITTDGSRLDTALLYDPAVGTFTLSGAVMTESRGEHTATVLPDGRVLLVGGSTAPGSRSNTAEFYDEFGSNGFIAITDTMTTERNAHSATYLVNGTVLIAGGRTNSNVAIAGAEVFDITTEQFTDTTGPMGGPRSDHVATLLPNGTVLIAAGSTHDFGPPIDSTVPLASAELYDIATGTFAPTGSLPAPRTGASASGLSLEGTLMPNGQVLIVGGANDTANALDTSVLYHIDSGTFTQSGDMATARRGAPALFLEPEGQVLVVGGASTNNGSLNTAELYTPNLCGPEADITLVVDEVQDPVAVGVGGSPLQYNIDLTNNGPDDAAQVEFTLTVPEGATFDSATGATCSEAGGVVSCSVGPLANAGTVMAAVIFQTNTATPGIRSSDIEVQLVGEFDPDFGNNAETETTIFQSTNPETDLVVSITDTPDPVNVGGTYRYTLNVDNMGTDVAIATLVAADIPEGVTLDSTSFPGGTCVPDTGVGPLTTGCQIGDLDVFTGTQIVLNVTATTEGMKAFTATATSDAVPDVDGTNNTDIAENTFVAGAGQRIFVVNDVGDAGDFDLADDVCSIANNGPCTLRAAIQQANQTANDPAGPDIIAFNILPGGVQTILPNSALPNITDPVVIDCTTQPGFVGTPIIELNGSAAGDANGLVLSGGNSTVRGLVINRFVHQSASSVGIAITGVIGNNLIEGNYIGPNLDGLTAPLPAENTTFGVHVLTANNRIVDNVISGTNAFGVFIQGGGATGTVLQGNKIGTDFTGMASLPNATRGIYQVGPASGTLIGTDENGVNDVAERNIIAGNTTNILIQNSDTNTLAGNHIGINADGTAAIVGSNIGIHLLEATGNRIGGLLPASRNIISGQAVSGVVINGASATNNSVQGNYIGPNAAGSGAVLGQDQDQDNGVVIQSGASDNLIGGPSGVLPTGPCVAPCNLISGNGMGITGSGVSISGVGTTLNRIEGNFIGSMVDGLSQLPNTLGVIVGNGASGNVVGGTAAGTGNLISGNSDNGVTLIDNTGFGGTGNRVEGNFIGTNVTGDSELPNLGFGVAISRIALNVIGGPTAATRNVISGNTNAGVNIFGAGADQNTIQNNFIGVNQAGTGAVGNQFGITSSDGTTGSIIDQNVISGNRDHGILLIKPGGSLLPGPTGTVITANLLGTNAAGDAPVPNANAGVAISDSVGNFVGDGTPAGRNIISGNIGNGVLILGPEAEGNVVQGNYIGTDQSGANPLEPDSNRNTGVFIFAEAHDNIIGGTTEGARNVISGNNNNGIHITDIGTTGNDIQGNYIGTDPTGLVPVPNGQLGVVLSQGASGNTVGGIAAGAGNVISGNTTNGVQISGADTTGNAIQGNFIGTDKDRSVNLGNGGIGVAVTTDAHDNTIGGTDPAASNVISFNGAGGVHLVDTAGPGNAIRGNAIVDNVFLGINLDIDGVTPNDPQDVDGSPNNLQNYPVLETATRVTGGTRVTGTFNSTPDSSFTLEFFSNAACDPSGFGEGETFVDAVPATPAIPDALAVTTDSNGDATISATIDAVLPGRWLTATATDTTTNDTSEFSACISVKAEDRIYGTQSQAVPGHNTGLPSHLISFVPDETNFPTSADLIDHGPLQSQGTDIFVDGLALSHTHGLVGFEGEGAPDPLTGMRLVRIDPITAEVTPIRVPFDPALKGLRGAVFDRDDQLWVVDTDTDEVLRIDPVTGQEVGSSRMALTVGGSPFDAEIAGDLAIQEDGTMYLVHVSTLYVLDPSTGILTAVFTDTALDLDSGFPPAFTGLTFSTLAPSDRIFGTEGRGQDDVYFYDIDTAFARTEFLEHLIPAVDIGLSDLAAFTPVRVDITIDATALTAPQFQLKQDSTIIGTFDTTPTNPVLALTPGIYTLSSALTFEVTTTGGAIQFEVTQAGTLDYDSSLDSVLSGRGSTTLTVQGVSLTVDATALDARLLFSMYGVVSSQSVSSAQVVTLVPGQNEFHIAGQIPNFGFFFDMGSDGVIDFDPTLDAYVSGRGTSTLTVTGFPVTIDTSNLTAPQFAFMGHQGIDATSGGVSLQLMPHGYNLQSAVTTTATTRAGRVDFTVETDGTITLTNPALEADGIVSGDGTNALAVTGIALSVDATALTADSLNLFGVNNVLPTKPAPQALQLMPGDHLVKIQNAQGDTGFTFTADPATQTVAYDANLDVGQGGFLSGQGTTTLVIQGYPIQINATALGTATFDLPGTVTGLDATVVQPTLLIPGDYQFVPATGTPFVFTVTPGGTIDFDASLNGFLTGRGTKTLLINADPGAGGLVFTVNSVSDGIDENQGDGLCYTGNTLPGGEQECTLRAAIQEANHANNAGLDLIAFDIGETGGVQTISPTGPLPALTDPVILDGTTQPGFAGVPIIEIEGSQAGSSSGIGFATSDSVMRGFVINRFKTASGPSAGAGVNSTPLNVEGHHNNLFELNYFGTDMSGNATFPASQNLTYGVILSSSSHDNVVRNNVLSGNTTAGILIRSSIADASQGTDHNIVIGNRIGIAATTDDPLPNGSAGILLVDNANHNRIGSDADGINDEQERNIISGHAGNDGIRMQSVELVEGPSNNIVAGNYIGTNTAGDDKVPNNRGIVLNNSSDNTIGGTVPAARNIISGNDDRGVYIVGGSTGNIVQGNFIGLNALGGELGNGSTGIALNQANGNIIGGTVPGARNVISGNASSGIWLESGNTQSQNNMIQGNYIGTNVAGDAEIPNATNGITFGSGSSHNTVGGDNPPATPECDGACNLISGNASIGVFLFSGDASALARTSDNTIQGNFIGISADGLAALGNTANNIGITGPGADHNTVGGVSATQRNVISASQGGNGISIGNGADNNVIQGNFIGTDATGSMTDPDTVPESGDELGNGIDGIILGDGAHDNLIGGTVAGSGNVISGNARRGILITGAGTDDNRIEGNKIGTDVTGTVALPNLLRGIQVGFSGISAGTIIGGTEGTTPHIEGVQVGRCTGACNLISGNGSNPSNPALFGAGTGIRILSGRTTVLGNFIGTDATGKIRLSNTHNGIRIESANNVIGGNTPEARNVISGNGFNDVGDVTPGGIAILGSAAINNDVQGNYIGTDVTGSGSLANQSAGIRIIDASANMVGDEGSGEGNLIAFNGDDGIAVTGATSVSNRFVSNSIHSNGDNGLDLDNDGVTPNDPDDVDGSPNRLQNFPVIDAAMSSPSGTTIEGMLDSTPNHTFRVEFFGNQVCDGSGHGEGETVLGSTQVVTDPNGDGAFSVTVPGVVPVDQFVTATATDEITNDTSEFSACAQVTASAVLLVNSANDVDDGTCDGTHCSLREAINAANAAPEPTTIHFNLTGTAPFTIQPDSANGPLPALTTPIILDGTSQPDYVDRPVIELEGSLLAGTLSNGLVISGSNSLVRGLAINNFPLAGIRIEGGQENTVVSNYLGTDVTGTLSRPNGQQGILLTNGANANAIGGTVGVTPGGACTGDCNLISGNTTGVLLNQVANTSIVGNFIGTNAAGTASVGSPPDAQIDGIVLNDAPNNMIGGTQPAARNLLSGNQGVGVRLLGTGSTGNTIQGNFVGVDREGTSQVRNADGGIFLRGGASNNTIGGEIGTTPGGGCTGDCNVISGNSAGGIILLDANTTNNRIQGNFIGPNATGATGLVGSAQLVGIDMRQATNTIVGGTDPGGRNVISGNNIGVRVQDSASGNILQGNFIGTDASGTAAVTNAVEGIQISHAPGNTIGGVTGTTPGGVCTGACNVISGNGTDGTNASAVHITGAGAVGNEVYGNFIGPDMTGTYAIGNPDFGLSITNLASGTTVGTGTPEGRNVISGQGNDGILITAPAGTGGTTGNVVQGNYIGTDTTGTVRLPFLSGTPVGNGGNGVTILHAASNTIGGSVPGAKNVISGNGVHGMHIFGQSATANVLRGNYVGTNAEGTAAVANGNDGMNLATTEGNIIGGPGPHEGNVLAGNGDAGIEIEGAVVTPGGHTIQGNRIGVGPTGVPLGNAQNGLELSEASNNIVGGVNPGEGNIITNSGLAGVAVVENISSSVDPTGNRILGNSIFGNAGSAIDLDVGGTTPGVNPNDLGDGDDGPNNLQNFPENLVVESSGSGTTIAGDLDTLAGNYRVEFFANASCDGTHGEGQMFLGATTVTHSGAGLESFSAPLAAPVPVGQIVTATATNLGTNDTSEFSPCATVTAFVPSPTTIVTTTAASGPGSLAEAVTAANATPEPDVITFNIPGAGPHVIQPTASVTVTAPVIIDGYSQPGASPNTLSVGSNAMIQIVVDGANAGTGTSGIFLRTSDSTVRGLAVTNWGGNGIRIEPDAGGQADNNTITGNHIGTDAAGLLDQGNSSDGIQIITASGTTVGGLTPADRNVLSGNGGEGIDLTTNSTNTLVIGNYIGTDATGEGPLSNSAAGILLNAVQNNMIGGTTEAARNIISANGSNGLLLNQISTMGNVVQGNYIGLTASGTLPLGNQGSGVFIWTDAQRNTIGGVAPGAGNVISGNSTIGVQINNSLPGRNMVQGNLIGVDPSGTKVDADTTPGNGNEFGNQFGGILIRNSSNNCVGGSLPASSGDPCVAPFAGNVVAGNGTDSSSDRYNIIVQTHTDPGDPSTANSIQGNRIGTDATGTAIFDPVPDASGILLQDDISTWVGGTEGTTPHLEGVQEGACTGACNLIAGHRNSQVTGFTGMGIHLRSASDGAIIQGNYIGTDITGTISDPNEVPNDGDEFGNDIRGILLIEASTNTQIGGVVPEARNLVAGSEVGITIQGFSSDVTIQGNYVGTDKTGMAALPNNSGISLAQGVTGTLVGGTENVQPDGPCSGACNLLSGNGVEPLTGPANGLFISGATETIVQGNFIGTDVTGTQVLSNLSHGLRIESSNNLIGGSTPEARNLVSGNGRPSIGNGGILLFEGNSTANEVLGNYIGTTANGQAALPNVGGHGINIVGASNNVIGGLQLGERNVIAGHADSGIRILPSSISPELSTGNVIQGNLIGISADGATPLPNLAGINVVGTNSNTIGPANTIAFNRGSGMRVSGPEAIETTILSNQIYANVGLGIALAGGANNDQPAPTLDVVLSDGAGTTVSGTASGPAGETVTVELYANTVCNGDAPTNFGEGERVLGTTPVALDGSGQGSFVVTLPGAPTRPEITATATDAAGNTSAFSACVTAQGNQAPTAAGQTAPAELEDTPQLLTLSGTDPDSATLTFAIDTSPSQGSLSELGVPDCTAQGQGTSCTASVTYTPAPEAFGPDHFTFTVSDGTEGSAPASVELTVTAVPEPPVATGDTVHVLTIPAGSPTQATPVAVLGNDHDPDGDPLTVTAVTDGTNGTVAVVMGGGAVTYSPTPGFPGPGDTFTYTISDGTATATATVVVVYESSTARLTVDRGGVGTGTVTSATGAIACGSTCAADIPVNQLVLLTAAADAGSVFAGWSGSGIDCPGLTPTCQVVVDAAKTVTATFGNDVVFLAVRPDEGSGVGTVVDTTPGGLISCGEDCNAQPPRGTTVVLEATAAGGSEFAGWSGGGCSGTGVCEVTLDTTVTDIVATFHLMGIVDSDGDGIPDADEARLQTDPHSADTDGDGILDGPDTCKSTPNGAEDAVGQGDEDFDSRDGLFNLGDACDEDADNDGWVDKVAQARDPMTPFLQLFTRVAPPLGDNCPLANNVDQADLDGDTRGNDCDEDADADSFVNHAFGGLDCNDFDATVVPGTVACGATEKPPKKNKNPPPDPELTDTDGDGLTDAEEGVIGTLPDNPDTDGDQVVDGSDNCPLNANGVTNWTDIHGGQQSATQPDRDLDGVGDMCDTDEDADGVPDKDRLSATVYVPKPVSEGGDNCPALPNTDQANLDSGTGDEQGDVCDPDADADGVVGVGKPGATGDPEIDDCEDLNALINPTRDEVQYNGVDDDCDEATPDSEFSIVVELEDPADGNATLANWLPTDGRQAILTATVVDDQGPLPQQPAVEFDLVSVSQYPGRYTNDESEGLNPTNPAEDYAYDLAGGGNQATLTAQDYGATITLQLDTVVDVGGVMVTVSRLVTVPADRDGDLLPDVWEDAFGDLGTSQDTDMTPGNPFDGDGLSAHKEYRGFMWGLLAPPEPGSPEADLYNTPALVPTPPLVQFFRGSPARKELFIEYAGFEPELPCACPFAIGTGFVNAGIDVYALPVGHVPDPGRRNLDVGQILNDQVNTHDEQDGHINKTGVRAQSFDTKGWSGVGDGEVYGGDTTHFQIPLDFYFADRMYVDANGNGVLDPLEAVEDKNDNNRIDIIDFNTGETEDSNSNQVLDGDTVILDSYTHEVTTMDIDDDGAVELPAVPSPAAIDPQLEQGKAAVLKHTVTHELGHMAGATHTGDMTDVMHTYSRNWVRDHHFGTSVAALKIHNTPTNAAEP